MRRRSGQGSFVAGPVVPKGDVVLNGKHASEVTFSALVSGDGGSGMVDGELVCLVLPSDGSGYAVFIQVAAPQGDLSSITDDIEAMAGSVELSR